MGNEKQAGQKKGAPALIYCDRCDGCGWYEGGPTLQTKCEVCKGTGAVHKDKSSTSNGGE